MHRGNQFVLWFATVIITALLVAGAIGFLFRSEFGMHSMQMASGHAEHRDSSMHREHAALFKLMPGAGFATHVAKTSGDWFDEKTWDKGEVPAKGAIVYVPPSITVVFEGGQSNHLFMVRVDGILEFRSRHGATTKMIVDTMFTTPMSKLSVHAAADDDGNIEVEFRPFDIEAFKLDGTPGWGKQPLGLYSDGARVTDTGAGTRRPRKFKVVADGPGVLGRYHWDPLQLSLGLITHGVLEIEGKPKLHKSAIEQTPGRGDQSIVLSDQPDGWMKGDVVVVTGSHYVGRDLVTGGYLGSEDEIRTIVEVDGKRISFNEPLEFEHDTPREDLKVYAANLTRNILFRSADGLDLDNLNADEAGSISSRLGHVMFMHNEKVRIRFAEFDDLGRTNKNDVADDFRRAKTDSLVYGRVKTIDQRDRRRRRFSAAKRRAKLTDPNQVIKAADAALYRAKKKGRNRVEVEKRKFKR